MKKCCKPLRSSLKRILPTGFFPPPLPILQDSTLAVPKFNSIKDTEFASLLLTLVSNLQPDLNGLKFMPYDFYCPTVQDKLEARTCKNCRVYFASKKL